MIHFYINDILIKNLTYSIKELADSISKSQEMKSKIEIEIEEVNTEFINRLIEIKAKELK